MEINLRGSLCFSLCFTCIVILKKKCTNLPFFGRWKSDHIFLPCIFLLRKTSNNAVGESISICSSIIKISHYLLYLLFSKVCESKPQTCHFATVYFSIRPKEMYFRTAKMSSHQKIFKHLPLPQIKFGFCGFISLELSHMGDGVLLSPLMSDLMLNTCVLLRVSRMEMPCGYPEQHIVVPFVTGRNSVWGHDPVKRLFSQVKILLHLKGSSIYLSPRIPSHEWGMFLADENVLSTRKLTCHFYIYLYLYFTYM